MQVRALRDCFAGHYWKQGEEGEYLGPANGNLESLEPPAKPVKVAKPEAPKPVAVPEGPKPQPETILKQEAEK